MDAPLSDEERMMIFMGRVDRAMAELQRSNAEKNYKIERLEREIERLKNDTASALAVSLQAASQKGALLLIDGSGSMGMMDPNPIEQALRAAQQKRIGGAVLWGARQPVIIDVKNEKHIASALRGLHAGTELAPTLDIAARLVGPQHFIIVSDGDVFDGDRGRAQLETLFRRNPQAKLDVVIVGAAAGRLAPTPMETMIRSAVFVHATQRPRIVHCNMKEQDRDLGSVITTLVYAAGTRKKAAAPKL